MEECIYLGLESPLWRIPSLPPLLQVASGFLGYLQGQERSSRPHCVGKCLMSIFLKNKKASVHRACWCLWCKRSYDGWSDAANTTEHRHEKGRPQPALLSTSTPRGCRECGFPVQGRHTCWWCIICGAPVWLPWGALLPQLRQYLLPAGTLPWASIFLPFLHIMWYKWTGFIQGPHRTPENLHFGGSEFAHKAALFIWLSHDSWSGTTSMSSLYRNESNTSLQIKRKWRNNTLKTRGNAHHQICNGTFTYAGGWWASPGKNQCHSLVAHLAEMVRYLLWGQKGYLVALMSLSHVGSFTQTKSTILTLGILSKYDISV